MIGFRCSRTQLNCLMFSPRTTTTAEYSITRRKRSRCRQVEFTSFFFYFRSHLPIACTLRLFYLKHSCTLQPLCFLFHGLISQTLYIPFVLGLGRGGGIEGCVILVYIQWGSIVLRPPAEFLPLGSVFLPLQARSRCLILGCVLLLFVGALRAKVSSVKTLPGYTRLRALSTPLLCIHVCCRLEKKRKHKESIRRRMQIVNLRWCNDQRCFPTLVLIKMVM